MPLPTLVIVGAQKSGTTTLHDLLRQHPQAWMSEPKELHFFDKYFDRGLAWYEEQFQPGPPHLRWGESTPIYLYSDLARSRMAASLPDADFVVLLREPVARAYSHYWFARSKGRERLASFEEAVAAEPDRLLRRKQGQRAAFSYVDRGRYVHQLEALESLVGRRRLFVRLTDDLEQDPKGVVRELCDQVGLDTAPVERITVRSRNTFEQRTASSYPPIDDGFANELRKGFLEDNERLEQWLGRDLTAWMPR